MPSGKGNQAGKKSGTGAQYLGKPSLEWIAFAVGLLAAIAIVGLLVWDVIEQDGSPPAVHVEAGPVRPYPGGFAVEIAVSNKAGAAAARVEIEGVLRQSGQAVETSRTIIDYVPGHSARRAGLFFTHDPRRFDLQLRALGYAQP
jgi:uncharacterized protein (TIGR02588 family)